MAIRHPSRSGDEHPCPACRTQPSTATTADPTEEIILGVDTHKDAHVAAVITILGVPVATATFPTTTAGYRELLAWARSFGVLCRAGVEGTGSYGAALARLPAPA